jgi:hypothetical protein
LALNRRRVQTVDAAANSLLEVSVQAEYNL